MELKTYIKELPKAAMTVRVTVFVDEQGFTDEFDDTDRISTHFVLFDDNGIPIANCRVFTKDDSGIYFLGRLAVIKERRGRHYGARMVRAAEEYVRSVGGHTIALHSQAAASGFYLTLGYFADGEPDEEQGCPHIWMKKKL